MAHWANYFLIYRLAPEEGILLLLWSGYITHMQHA